MRSLTISLIACISLCACRTVPDYSRPLPPGVPALQKVAVGDWPDFRADWFEAQELLPALERSIAWMEFPSSSQHFPIEGVSFDLARNSLRRFREVLMESVSAAEFQAKLEAEFDVYQSAGWNGEGGGVLFTGYYTPIFPGRLSPEGPFQHALYGLPPDLEKGPQGEILGQRTAGGLRPYPGRKAIEASGMLSNQGLELVYLESALDSFITHVNGSAFVELPSGELAKFGYAGKNGQPYSSLGKALIEAGELRADEVSLPAIREWAEQNPNKIQSYLDRNASYVFFTDIAGNPRGSLNLEVEAGRSLATDKSLFPRGAVTFIDTRLPSEQPGREVLFERFMMDQDTGGAIRTAGRGDLYLGVGPEAGQQAGRTKSPGQLYYLFLQQ